MKLPRCKHRGEKLETGRYVCSHPLVTADQGVSETQCAKHCKLHDCAEGSNNTNKGTCIHLGQVIRDDNGRALTRTGIT